MHDHVQTHTNMQNRAYISITAGYLGELRELGAWVSLNFELGTSLVNLGLNLGYNLGVKIKIRSKACLITKIV